jgi:hypothetical protein
VVAKPVEVKSADRAHRKLIFCREGHGIAVVLLKGGQLHDKKLLGTVQQHELRLTEHGFRKVLRLEGYCYDLNARYFMTYGPDTLQFEDPTCGWLALTKLYHSLGLAD